MATMLDSLFDFFLTLKACSKAGVPIEPEMTPSSMPRLAPSRPMVSTAINRRQLSACDGTS